MLDITVKRGRIYTIDSNIEGTGLWGLVEGTEATIRHYAQSMKNDKPNKTTWYTLDGGRKHFIENVTAKAVVFEKDMIRREPSMIRKAPEIKRMAK